MRFDNDVTNQLGVEVPLFSAPMGMVAGPALVTAMARAGGMGLVPGSLPVPQVRDDIRRVREGTDRPFGVNIPLAFAKDPAVVDMIVAEGIGFVTTSAGSPARLTPILKDAGLVVYHVVPTLEAALKAVDAGVDGLVVEGSEGAGFKSPHEVSTMVLLPLVVSRVDVPVVAAGGIVDGASLLAAFALGAQGAQMGTRMLASLESGVHPDVKRAVVGAREVDTMMYNRAIGRPMRVLRTETTTRTDGTDPRPLLAEIRRTYDDGDLEASLAQMGQVAGRVDDVLAVEEIVRATIADFTERLSALAGSYGVVAGARG
ncbi:NAD(P)H-dependent flavin oxidoreductase [Nocardioides dongxiaopingii]|uniref:NAD(P)H-dependent flavin oxidoreductase n=1 Tax=Nocardioides dongxiaopingii TaxID=2576036 RepID=UPI0010C766DD|nr:nitronate monooxygenase [Nocardioides dongxiaopingii]